MNSGGLATPSLPPIAEDPPPPPPPPPRGPRLPRPFLQSLRVLFEILDDRRQGTVHISEIESRWGRGGSGVAPQADREIPAGVLQALQQAAEPCGGFLSFPRLVAGLRIALLQPEDGGAAEAADGGRGAAQGKKTSRIRESDGKGVTRSRSTNSFLSQSGRCRMNPKEPRRHTISGAVEYEMLKQMQQLERERDALVQGLEMVNQVRDWLQCHLLEAQKRQKHMGAQATDCRDSYSKQSCLLLAKIQEVNLCLKSLLTSSGKPEVPPRSWGVPFSSPENPFHQQAIVVLKEQNHLLTKEVSQKCHRIAQLEEEKASLCKQLKESWGYKLPSHKEFTFI